MRTMEKNIQPIAVSAILEHEAIPGLASSGARARSGSTASSQPTVRKAMDDLLSILTIFHRTLTVHGVDPELFSQFFRQVSVFKFNFFFFFFLPFSSLQKGYFKIE